MCGTADGVVKVYSCIMVENDGSVEKPHIEKQKYVKFKNLKNTIFSIEQTSASIVQARLERQRRRLKVAASQDTVTSSTVSNSHSPEPPQSPATFKNEGR